MKIVIDKHILHCIILEIGSGFTEESYKRDFQEAINGVDKREIGVLIQKLENEEEDVEGTISLLENYGKRVIEPLKALVNHKNKRIRNIVAQLLENVHLLDQLESQDFQIIKESAETLAKRGNQRGVDKLFEIFSDGLYEREIDSDCYYHPRVLFDILINLNEKERLVEVLLERLERHLKYYGREQLYEDRYEIAFVIIELLILTKDVETLISTLDYFGYNSTFDNRVIDAMIELNDKRVIKPLIDTLSIDNWEIKVTVLRALSHFGTLIAIQPIIQQLSYAHRKVRKAAKTALIDLEVNDDMSKTLTKMIEGKKQQPRFNAAIVLGYKGDKQIVPYLKEITQEDDREKVMVATDVLEELGELDSKEIYSFLNTYFEDNTWFGRYAGAAELLVKTLPLLEKILETQQDELTKSEDDFKPIQVDIDENWMHQIVEIICIPEIEITQRLRAINIFLEDAKRTLIEQEAWEETQEAITTIMREKDDYSSSISFVQESLRTVIEKYGELSIQPIIVFMNDCNSSDDIRLKTALIYTLGEAKDKQAIKSLTEISNNTKEDSQVRTYATEALEKVGER